MLPSRILARLAAASLALGCLVAGAQQPDAARPTAAASGPEAPLYVKQRKVAVFRATLLGDTPAERAELAGKAIHAALAKGKPARVTSAAAGESVRFEIDGVTAFFLVPGDFPGARPAADLETAAPGVRHRLDVAVREVRESQDPKALWEAAWHSALALLLALVVVRAIFLARRVVQRQAQARLKTWLESPDSTVFARTYGEYSSAALNLAIGALAWLLALATLDAAATYVLGQFPYTRPWSEQSTEWLLGMGQRLMLEAAGAIPGLLVAVLIFALARLAAHAAGLFLKRVERGEAVVAGLDVDTAGPTRRIVTLLIWLFALAMAYPYLPGSGSEAFKGVSVLAGVMLSLGASGIVGQAVAGMSLMYSRAIRVGEYVRVGDTEGTVTSIGLFATRFQTGMGEEVSLPNAGIFGQSVRNYSRLASGGRFVLHTAVTIGYATPWREVHEMLLEAARRTPGVSEVPAPYVVQSSLSDFYVEYRLCAQCSLEGPQMRARAMSHLHASIQDVFAERGVQIMSPHYMADPPTPQVPAPPPSSAAQR